MSQVQPIIPTPIRPAWQAFLIRATPLDTRRWSERRTRGRGPYIRRVWLGGLWFGLLMLPAGALITAWRRGLPWGAFVAPSVLGWFGGIVLAVVLALRVWAPFEWWRSEEKYRDELAKLGRRPAPPAA